MNHITQNIVQDVLELRDIGSLDAVRNRRGKLVLERGADVAPVVYVDNSGSLKIAPVRKFDQNCTVLKLLETNVLRGSSK